jgi:hypothetical protein
MFQIKTQQNFAPLYFCQSEVLSEKKLYGWTVEEAETRSKTPSELRWGQYFLFYLLLLQL